MRLPHPAAAATAAALALGLPATAVAQDAPVQPVRAKIALTTAGTLRDGARSVVVAGQSWQVRGTLRPYLTGERVTVTLLRDGRPVRRLRPRLVRGPRGRAATFAVTIRRRTPGSYAARATHARTARMAYARSNRVRVRALAADFAYGRGGAAVRLLQRGLRRLRYAAGDSGVYDAATARAVMAWRKVTHRRRSYAADRGVLRAVLAGRGAWRVRHPRDGRHVEADLSLQAMALVDGRRVVRVQHISSGKPSTPTVLGRYRVYRKDPGTNSQGMVHSSYFIRGYAIHGYVSVPAFGASHGCLRVPIPDAWAIYSWLRLGDVVWVEP